jgi:hypothetical protein
MICFAIGRVRYARVVTLAEIKDKLAYISGVWRSEMASEQRRELADLDLSRGA